MKHNVISQATFGAIVILGLGSYYLLFQENALLLIGAVGLLALSAVLFLRPNYGIPALLIVRPLVDSIGEYRFSLGTVGFNVAGALSLLAIGWSLWILVRHRTRLWSRELFWAMLLLVLLSVFSLTYTPVPSETLTEIVRISGFFLLYLAARELITDWVSFRRIALAFALSLLIPVAVSFIQVATNQGLTFADSTNRAYGTFGHPNVLAFYLVLAISFFITAWPLVNFRPGSRWPFNLILLLALLLTQTRGAWLGLLVALAVIGFIRFRRLFVGGIFGLTMLIAILPTVNSVTSNVFGVNLQTVPGIKEVISRQAERSSYQWRIDVWEEMGRRFYERPLLGFGLGSFPTIRSLQVFDFFQGIGAHNDYLRLLIELGLIGTLAYGALLAGIFWYLGRLFRFLGSHPLSYPVLGLIGFSAAYAVMSIFDNLLQATAVLWAYMILLGAAFNFARTDSPAKKNS